MSSLTALLNIRHPIVQSGMGRVAGPELAAEVSRAGGLGILGGLNVPPDDLRAQIRRMRELTTAPFGLNLWLHPAVQQPIDPASLPATEVDAVNAALNPARRAVGLPPSTAPPPPMPHLLPAAIDVLIEERVPLWSVGLGLPSDDLVARCHARDVRIMATVTNVADARAAAAAGVDVIVAQGAEAGGHRSIWRVDAPVDVGTFALIPDVSTRSVFQWSPPAASPTAAASSPRARWAPPAFCSARASSPRASRWRRTSGSRRSCTRRRTRRR